MQVYRVFIFVFCCVSLGLVSLARAGDNLDQRWYSLSEQSKPSVYLYFFWSKKCPHCLEAVPFVEQLDNKHDWLTVYSRELTEHPEHVEQYIAMAAQLGQEARSVPAFMWCGNMTVGYDNPDNIGRFLELELVKCYDWLKGNAIQPKPETISLLDNPVIILPLLGTMSLTDYSLPAYTIILAGLDAFNPCAFFVLLFL